MSFQAEITRIADAYAIGLVPPTPKDGVEDLSAYLLTKVKELSGDTEATITMWCRFEDAKVVRIEYSYTDGNIPHLGKYLLDTRFWEPYKIADGLNNNESDKS